MWACAPRGPPLGKDFQPPSALAQQNQASHERSGTCAVSLSEPLEESQPLLRVTLQLPGTCLNVSSFDLHPSPQGLQADSLGVP